MVITYSSPPFSESVAHHDQHVLDTAVPDLSEHPEPEPGALAAVAGPDAEGVSFPTAITPSLKCTATPPVVKPHAVNNNTISSIPSKAALPLAHIFGSNDPSRSLGNLDLNWADSVSTVFVLVPLREVSLSVTSLLTLTEMLAQFRVQRGLQHCRRQAPVQTTRTNETDACSVACANIC